MEVDVLTRHRSIDQCFAALRADPAHLRAAQHIFAQHATSYSSAGSPTTAFAWHSSPCPASIQACVRLHERREAQHSKAPQICTALT